MKVEKGHKNVYMWGRLTIVMQTYNITLEKRGKISGKNTQKLGGKSITNGQNSRFRLDLLNCTTN